MLRTAERRAADAHQGLSFAVSFLSGALNPAVKEEAKSVAMFSATGAQQGVQGTGPWGYTGEGAVAELDKQVGERQTPFARNLLGPGL